MGEAAFGHNFERRLAVDEKIEAIGEALIFQIEHPPGGDDIIAAFAEGVTNALGNAEVQKEFQLVLKNAIEYRPAIEPEYVVNLLQKGLQWILMDDADYPLSYTTPDKWSSAFINILGSPDTEKGFVALWFALRLNIASNVAERYKSLKLVGSLLTPNAVVEPRILDVGCSQNQGLKHLGAQLDFDQLQLVVESKVDSHPDATAAHNGILNQKLRQPWVIGPSLGVDVWTRDMSMQKWARACRFRPRELLNERLVQQYDWLDNNPVPNLSVQQCDFTSQQDIRKSLSLQPTFDIVNFSTMLYMLTPEDRKKAVSNAMSLVKPDGHIVIQDFAERDPERPNNLLFHNKIYQAPFLYRTFVMSAASQHQGFKELFVWESGRCQRLRLGNDFVMD